MPDAIADRVLDIIGGTPMVRLENLSPAGGATIVGKMEYLNPGGSVKDRIALNMIRDAEEKGVLKPGMTIVEATSGNTGIGLAMLCAKLNYRLVLTMPETMSFERRALVIRYGAEVVITPGSGDMDGAKQRAQEIVAKNANCIELKQFDNPANPEVHRQSTGPEIVKATGGKVTAFVAGVGTGGTITGVGEVLKAEVPDARVIAVVYCICSDESRRNATADAGCADGHCTGIAWVGCCLFLNYRRKYESGNGRWDRRVWKSCYWCAQTLD
ncbi:MAG: PLP-dependent cysteine synthase family protein [Candidatus Latescibacteria bacterium]|nr:PLP-dependent cysteine synthase family protein [Candidatus Latescibacterota bacterium]